MADDNTRDNRDDDEAVGAACSQDTTPANDESDFDEPGGSSSNSEGLSQPHEPAPDVDLPLMDTPGASHRFVANQDNASRLGQLLVYYPERTITLPLDGDAALRALSAWQHDELWRGDELDPRFSSADAMWAVLQLGQRPLAMLWMPNLPTRTTTDRMAIDPEPQPV